VGVARSASPLLPGRKVLGRLCLSKHPLETESVPEAPQNFLAEKLLQLRLEGSIEDRPVPLRPSIVGRRLGRCRPYGVFSFSSGERDRSKVRWACRLASSSKHSVLATPESWKRKGASPAKLWACQGLFLGGAE